MDENQIEDFDSTNEVVDDTQNTVSEETEQDEGLSEEELMKLRESNKKLFERAKKAEEQLKALKAKPEPQIINNTPVDISEELRLIARGLSDAEIDKAKVIAKGAGTSLTQALQDDLFIAFQAKLKDDARKERAKLGASKGSGQMETEKGFKSGLTREEHMALWKETQA